MRIVSDAVAQWNVRVAVNLDNRARLLRLIDRSKFNWYYGVCSAGEKVAIRHFDAP
jgi:hypothetical protein